MTISEDAKTMSTILKISKWIIPFLLSGFIGASSYVGSRIDQRFVDIENTVSKNTVDIATEMNETKNLAQQLQIMHSDIVTIRETQERILIILTKRK